MEEIIARIKNNRIAQIALVAIIFVVILSFYVLQRFTRRSQRQLPCYNQTVRILSPFPRQKFSKIERIFSQYCLKLDIDVKSLDYIKDNLLKEIAEGEIPDLVYIDNNFIEENRNAFKEYAGEKISIKNYPETALILKNEKLLNYPIAFDTLVLFSNKKYLDILGIFDPPNNFEDLLEVIRKIKANPQLAKVQPIALGTSNNIENFYEIFITLHKNYNPGSYKNTDALFKTFDFYTQFADLKSPLYSWSDANLNSFEEFERGNVVFVFGFYSDSERIKKMNTRLNFKVSELPKFKNVIEQTNFIKMYSFVVPKQGKYKFAWKALEILDENYEDFIKDFDLLPVRKDIYENLEENKRKIAKDLIVGSLFDEFNRNYAEPFFKDAINKWLSDKENVKLSFMRGQSYKIFRK